jgi:hypothetical protein
MLIPGLLFDIAKDLGGFSRLPPDEPPGGRLRKARKPMTSVIIVVKIDDENRIGPKLVE